MIINKDKLDLALAMRKMTLKELSKRSGISILTLHKVNVRRDLRPKTVGKIADALNVKVPEII